MAAQEEPEQVEGRTPGQDQAHALRFGGGHHRRNQPQLAGLDEILPAQPPDGVPTAGPMDTPTAAEHPAQTTQA